MPMFLRALLISTVTICAAVSTAHAACESVEPEAQQTRPRADTRLIENIMRGAHEALARGEYGEACVKYRLVLSVDHDNVEARLGMAEGALGETHFTVARMLFDSVAEIAPDNALAQQGRGLALMFLGDTTAAEPALRRAVELDRTLWRAWNGLGVIADSRGEWSAADTAWTAALEAAPDEAQLHNNSGMSLIQRGDATAALAAFERALRIDPGFDTAAHNRRVALAMTGQYDAALIGVSERDRPSVLNNIAVVAARRGDRAVAERLLSAAITAAPRYYEVAERNRVALRQAAP